MKDLELARDATKRISEVAETIHDVITRKEAWLVEYRESEPEDLTETGSLARRILIEMLELNIAELHHIRDHLLAPVK